MKIQTLLDSENKWCKHSIALAADGDVVYECNPRAVRWCLVGAAMLCYPDDDGGVVRCKIYDILGQPIGDWNDAPERTFADVRKLIETLDI